MTDITRASILARLDEPHRRYHTRAHIEHCLAELAAVDCDDTTRAIIEDAILFHDAVYDTQAPSGANEHASAELWRAYATTHAAPHRETVHRAILATIDHVVPRDIEPATREAIALFLDIDLAILGQPAARYARYAQQVRAEYGWVPDDAYAAGRGQVLRALLDRPALFHTAPLRARYEATARANIRAELAELSR